MEIFRQLRSEDAICRLPSAEQQDDPSTNSQVILAVVEAIRQSGHEVLGLHGTNRDLLRHFEIDAAARRHREIILRPRLANPIRGPNTPEERLNEWRQLAGALNSLWAQKGR